MRPKTVFDNAQCAHVWAAQTQTTGKNSNNSMSFDCQTLYSYRTPIARIHVRHGGRHIVLITSDRYSVTTSSKHMPAARRAVSHLTTYYVPIVDPASRHDHDMNIRYMRAEYDAYYEHVKRARDEPYEWPERLIGLGRNAREYCEEFGLPPIYSIAWIDADITTLTLLREARAARLNTPTAIAARERAKVKRDAKRSEADRARVALRAEQAAHYAQQAAERAAEEAEGLPARIEAWRRSEPSERLGLGLRRMSPMLRVSKDGTQIQTSHGANVPYIAGLNVLCAIRDHWRTDPSVVWMQTGLRVGAFSIDQVSPTHVVAGCHHFERAEIESFIVTVGI